MFRRSICSIIADSLICHNLHRIRSLSLDMIYGRLIFLSQSPTQYLLNTDGYDMILKKTINFAVLGFLVSTNDRFYRSKDLDKRQLNFTGK